MCGDLEDDDAFEGDLHQRFVMRSQALLQREGGSQDPLNRYLDGLFSDLLRRCVDDSRRVAPGDAYQRVAMQSVVLARLAGFLAGHGALTDDPLHKLLEATMTGYAEAESPLALHDHGHGHGHDHDHGHDHGHEHEQGIDRRHADGRVGADEQARHDHAPIQRTTVAG